MKYLSSFFNFPLLLALFVVHSEGVEPPCPLKLTLDITDGGYSDDGAMVHNKISYPRGTYFEHKGSVRGCICKIRHCIRKCCEFGQAMVNKTCQKYPNDFRLGIHDQKEPITHMSSTHFQHIINHDCGGNEFYKLFPAFYEEDEFYLQHNGSLFLPRAETEKLLLPEQYCLEMFVDQEMTGNISALVCFEAQPQFEATYSFGESYYKPVDFIISYGLGRFDTTLNI